MQAILDEVLRYWYSLRLRILIALDTTEADAGGLPETGVPDIPGSLDS